MSNNCSPLISIIIPSYNRAHCVLKTLDSVFNQTIKNYEIIVVDDGSKDNTRNVLEPYKERIHYYYQENRGLAAARNVGLNNARGDYIALLDSDDIWMPDHLEFHLNNLRKNKDCILSLGQPLVYREHIGKQVKYFEFVHYISANGICKQPLTDQVEYGIAWVQCSLIRKNALEKINYYDEKLTIYTDVDLFSRLALIGSWYISDRIVTHILRNQGHNVSSQRLKNSAHSNQAMIYISTKLLDSEGLTPKEHSHVKRKLISYYSAIGNDYFSLNDTSKAMEFYINGIMKTRSIKLIMKYIIGLLPSFHNKLFD